MKIVFIQVGITGARSTDAMEPLAFAILAGLTPKHHTIEFYDDRIEAVPKNLDCDLVAISTGTFTARRAYQLAALYKMQNIKVVLGGYHPTFMPQEVLEYADSVILGDAENTWLNVLNDLEKGMLKSIYEAHEKPDISNVFFDESIFLGKKYSKITPVQYSRGCKFSCEFCCISAFYGSSIRYRDIGYVVDEIIRKKAKFVFFVDDNLFIDRNHTIAFLKALIPLKMKWVCQISIDIAADDELLQLMVQSGCICVLIGFETLNDDNLKQMKKAVNIAHINYDEVIKKLQSYGLMIYGTFILGYDMDTVDTFDTCLEFALKSQMILANFNPLMPMVGTKLYDRFKAEGRLIHDKWWLDPNYQYGDAMFIPKQMTPQQLKEGCYRIRSSFNTYSNIFKRGLYGHANREHLAIFLAANFINRREIIQKQGRLL
ncbi:MAG: B12-binding domain-containing radical SAM protein [Firmicutes bacterium HGW-Firmicutes-1]|nr:MAG: B12-binding domain-containing radical SAM protein [Firmicutes bacterium HGW-Firmicutes-1]